jgi:hypothetical protein
MKKVVNVWPAGIITEEIKLKLKLRKLLITYRLSTGPPIGKNLP